MKALFFCIILVVTINACNEGRQKISKRNNEIQKVSFATGGCYGTCPFLAIEIDSTLTYKFFGGRYADKEGYYTGAVTQIFWDSLNIRLGKVNFKHLDTLYKSTFDDMSIECYLNFGQTRKSIGGQEMSMPDSLREVFYWIMNSYKNLNLSKVDTLIFDTKIQFGPGLMPPPRSYIP
jgi:hypothetical protein